MTMQFNGLPSIRLVTTSAFGLAVSLLAVSLCTPVQADSQTAIAAQVSTLGLGAQVIHQFTPYVAGRLGFNSYSYNKTETKQDVTYDGHLNLKSTELLADLYPAKHTGFHFTLGYVNDGNKVTANGQPSDDTYTFNGNTYTAAEVGTVHGKLTWPTNGIYTGIGFGKLGDSGARVRLFLDFGAVLSSKPKFDLNASNPTHNSTLANDVAAQQESTQSDLNRLDVYPVIAIGIAVHI